MKDLSIIIISYNTREITRKSLEKLTASLKNEPTVNAQIIVVDNASSDDSAKMLKSFNLKFARSKNISINIAINSRNLGFSKANNQALVAAEGKYILFLNSDVIIQNVSFSDLIYYMNKNPEVGALTIKVILPSGKIDMASHRGFPTVWRSFTYFAKLEKFFGRVPKLSKIFGGYHLTHLELDSIHEIDSPSGAFYLTRKEILDKTGGFDTKFFMYGEDLDLSKRIKKLGFKIVYYPLFNVLHLKYKSGLKRGTKKIESTTKKHFYEAMQIFYDKHFSKKHSPTLNKLVSFFINLKKKY